MTYVALLRGINVGGNNKIDMKQLKVMFEKLGLEQVKTYINSGNIIFSDKRKHSALIPLLEKAIEKEFGFQVKVLLRDKKQIEATAKAIPDNWVNDQSMRSEVLFLWEEFDSPKVMDQLVVNPEVDNVKYASGAVVWMFDRKNYGKSKMGKLIGTKLYKNMTMRNANTVRKLVELMKAT